MKGAIVYPGKRRWRYLVIGVLLLVVLSMLVPLVFLLGLHNGFHSTGFVTDRLSSSSTSSSASDSGAATGYQGISEKQPNTEENADQYHPHANKEDAFMNHTTKPRNLTGVTGTLVRSHSLPRRVAVGNNAKSGTTELHVVKENNRECEKHFGSYCPWRDEQREDMKDSMIKKLKDQLFVLRAYFPSIAKLPGQNKLTQEIKRNIQELEHILSESTIDTDLPLQIGKISEKVEVTIARAKSFSVECQNVDKKFRQILDMTMDEAKFHIRQSAFLYQLVVLTLPKSLHCLSLRLTVEYFNSSLHDTELSLSKKFSDPALHHYVIISNNILASSVVINSTVMHAKDSGNSVFHLLTDEQNYFALKFWFARNSYQGASIQVMNIEHLDLDYHDKAALLRMALPVEFRVSYNVDNLSSKPSKTEYLSVFSHAHYLLPYIFPNLKKIVVLDDDVVVQRDLSDLWNLNMGGKVNGALQLCSVRLGQLSRYLSDNNFDKKSCMWMSGLNIIDLARWRELDLTETYRNLGQQVTKLNESFEASALRASLLTFQDQIYALDDLWVLPGLGHDYGLDVGVISSAAVLHYNGKRKPWLELGIARYKHYWKSYINRNDEFLRACNVH